MEQSVCYILELKKPLIRAHGRIHVGLKLVCVELQLLLISF